MTRPSTTPAATPPAVSAAANGPWSTCSRKRVGRGAGADLHDRPADERADEAGHPQPRRVPASLEEQGRDPRPDDRPDGEPRQAQERRHEAALRAPERRQQNPAEHEEIDAAHRCCIPPVRRRRSGCVPDCGGGVRAHRARSSAAPSESRGRVPGLERRGRGGQPRRRLPARGDRRRALRGHRLRAVHRLPADAADRRARRRRHPPARLARDRGVRLREVRPRRGRRHRAEHALAGVLGRHRRACAGATGSTW